MSDSTTTMGQDEFILVIPSFHVFAPISWTDEQGEEVYNKIAPVLVEKLGNIKEDIEEAYPNLRIGFNVG